MVLWGFARLEIVPAVSALRGLEARLVQVLPTMSPQGVVNVAWAMGAGLYCRARPLRNAEAHTKPVGEAQGMQGCGDDMPGAEVHAALLRRAEELMVWSWALAAARGRGEADVGGPDVVAKDDGESGRVSRHERGSASVDGPAAAGAQHKAGGGLKLADVATIVWGVVRIGRGCEGAGEAGAGGHSMADLRERVGRAALEYLLVCCEAPALEVGGQGVDEYSMSADSGVTSGGGAGVGAGTRAGGGTADADALGRGAPHAGARGGAVGTTVAKPLQPLQPLTFTPHAGARGGADGTTVGAILCCVRSLGCAISGTEWARLEVILLGRAGGRGKGPLVDEMTAEVVARLLASFYSGPSHSLSGASQNILNALKRRSRLIHEIHSVRVQ